MTLPTVSSFDDYETLKISPDLFKKSAQEIIARHQLPNEPLSLFDGTNIVFAYGHHRVIKIFPPIHQSHFKSELMVMNHLHNKLSVKTPTIEYHGTINDWPYMIMNRLDGTLLEGLWEKLDSHNKKILFAN